MRGLLLAPHVDVLLSGSNLKCRVPADSLLPTFVGVDPSAAA